MTKFKTMLLALVAVFAFSAVAASGASAHEWLFNGEPIEEAKAVDSAAEKLELTDLKGGVFGESLTVICSGKDQGTVGPGIEDSITAVTGPNGELNVPCESTGGGCETPVAMAVNLPWKTELFLNEKGELRDLLKEDGKGNPGWEVTCKSIIGNIKDTCTGETDLGVKNLATDVETVFDAISIEPAKRANCTRGGEHTGDVKGKVLIFSLEGSIQAD